MDEKIKNRLTELEKRFTRGQISRRDFLRSASLLGLALGAGEVLSACAPTEKSPLEYDPIETIYSYQYTTTTPYAGDKKTPIPDASGASAVDEIAGSASMKRRYPTWYCGCCAQRFRTLEELKKHTAAEHAWRLPEIQRVNQPTYSKYLVGNVQRFDEKNTVFSRTAWDEAYQQQVQEATAKAPQGDWETFEGNALVAGAIYVDATAGSLHPNYYGYFGHVNDVGGLYNWDDPVNPTQFPVPNPQWMAERVKDVARFYGADLVGICEIDSHWVYSNYFELVTGKYGKLEIPYKYAIVMGIEMDSKSINESPLPGASAATALAYSQMSELSASLAKYIRTLGYPAIPCGNDSAQSIPLAIDAGLGELGRNGLMLSPEFGPRQRICKVLTDIPLQTDKPIDFGLQAFCETCHACAAACPKDAIRWEDRTTERTSISNREGILRWPVNVANCYLFWRENGTDCSNCIAACPWALHSQRDWLEL